MKKHNKVKNQVRTVNNGLASAVGVDMYNNASLPLEIQANAPQQLLTLDWVTLANIYKANGFIKMAVDMPVDDAFRGGGFEFESGTLEAEELEELNEKVKELDLETIKQVARWGRLFGGGVLLCETGQHLDTPFNPETIYNKEIKFFACDRWQCYPLASSLYLAKTFVLQDLSLRENGGIIAEVDKSRLQVFTGEVQPYYIRNQLQGWGISLLECIIPQLNQYLKANRVILELLDEAKIDILKIFGLADNLMSVDGESAVKRRVSIFATQKNYKNVGVMDTQDDYDQKTMQFGGIDRLLEKIFLLICSSIRIPYSKAFGRGASGFSSGEDDLENYNAMIMSSVRVPIAPIIKWVGQIRACQLFGRKVDDLSIKWKPLRVLSEKEEQEIKSQKINSYVMLLQSGVLNRKQVAEQLQKDDIIAFSPEELKELENDTNFEEIEEESETVEEKQTIGDKFKNMFKK